MHATCRSTQTLWRRLARRVTLFFTIWTSILAKKRATACWGNANHTQTKATASRGHEFGQAGLTAANDGAVLWDTMKTSMKMPPATKLADSKGASVNDLSLSKTSADIAYSASEAKRIDVWDARKKGGPASSKLDAHAEEVMSSMQALCPNTYSSLVAPTA